MLLELAGSNPVVNGTGRYEELVSKLLCGYQAHAVTLAIARRRVKSALAATLNEEFNAPLKVYPSFLIVGQLAVCVDLNCIPHVAGQALGVLIVQAVKAVIVSVLVG